RGLRHALTQDLGFAAEGVAVVSLEMPFPPTDAVSVRGFMDRFEPALESLAAGGRVALAPALPMEAARGRLRLPGEEPQRARSVSGQLVSPGYFELLGVPLVAGRLFARRDPPERLVVVNEALARSLWPGETAVGRTLVW